MSVKGKKGYYFVIDALVGSTIIFVSLMILLNNVSKGTKVQYNYELSEEYSTFILTTQIQDISNPYINQLIIDGQIPDQKLTILEQVTLFYYRQDLTRAGELVQNITEPLIPPKYGFEYNIINGTDKVNIYTRDPTPIKDADLVISSKKITFLQINSSTLFGPAVVEIKTWI
jgi:hypothetical protein